MISKTRDKDTKKLDEVKGGGTGGATGARVPSHDDDDE